MVTEPAFKRLEPRAEEFTAVFPEEGASMIGMNLQGKSDFISPKRWRQHAIRAVGSHFQHHP
jgi:hypothetical protein